MTFYELNKAYNDCLNWEIMVEEKYDEESALSIEGMLAYMENQYNGFGHRNDELTYNEERNNDMDGSLYKEACYGFELFKIFENLTILINQKNIKFIITREGTLKRI